MNILEIEKSNQDRKRKTNPESDQVNRAAGSILFALDTGRFSLSLRSPWVSEPGTWGTWGGAMASGENPEQAAIRELREETRYTGPVRMHYLWTYDSGNGFQYHNFIGAVDSEFEPELNHENSGYIWFDIANKSEWPEPLHFGVKSLLSRPDVVKRLINIARDHNVSRQS